jgi:hypothetical protein
MSVKYKRTDRYRRRSTLNDNLKIKGSRSLTHDSKIFTYSGSCWPNACATGLKADALGRQDRSV